MTQSIDEYEKQYRTVLADYCNTRSEDALYQASLLSKALIQAGLGPDEIVALHYEGMQTVARDESLPHGERIRILNDAHQFLLEVMIAYGAQYKDYLDMRLAEAIRRAEDAELGQREKTEILVMIAHELGNPLTIALGNMQLAMRFLDAQDITTLRDLVEDSRVALERLAGLTSQLAAAGRGEHPTFAREHVNLESVVHRVLSLVHRTASEKQVDIVVQIPPGGVWVNADEEALSSIAGNLVNNAVRYTNEGGRVEVSVERQDDKAVITVADTGIGIPPEAIKLIFGKFYRTEDARSMAPQGMGMGLAIVEHLVEAIGGCIEVESEVGKGSKFRVLLPALKEEELGK